MLGLSLRKEFRGKWLKGTAIELANEKRTGATQVPATEFLEITYPTSDQLKAIEAVGPGRGRPVVLIGERGQGKSHLMAALYHALTNTPATRGWLTAWADRLQDPKVGSIELRSGMEVISESLHKHEYKFLWDMLFDRHPAGEFVRGMWEGQGERKTEVPPASLILELLRKKPTALLLDEFQTWFDGLTNTKQYPWRNWAFNFIQVLSEIAKEHPELLVLVVSVRNGQSDAYQQVHRVNPVQVDFKGPNAERDRRRLLLHRLFDNRLQVPGADIEKVSAVHVGEYLRLAEVPPADHQRCKAEFIEMWPFAPHLMQLLEDQVLVATDAQETRDLIRILAQVFKSGGETSPVLTAGDFRLDDDASGIAALLDSVANQHHATLREKAQRNLKAVQDAAQSSGIKVPHLSEIVGALWLRSLAVGNLAGAEPAMLHVDITREKPVDDNAFAVELSAIVENSFNIHQDAARLVFREVENPQAKLMSCARNDRLFEDRSDEGQLAREVRYVLGGSEEVAKAFRIIALPRDWTGDPWSTLEESEHPERWDDRLPIVVLPETPEKLEATLGRWVKEHLQRGRNTVRFLLPRSGSPNAFVDRDLLILARAVLKAQEWKAQSPEYGALLSKYQKELRGVIKYRFDRFALLKKWSFTNPAQCELHLESLSAQGGDIPEATEKSVRDDVFVPEDFESLVLATAGNNDSVGKLLRELQEPRPNEENCIPWLGETLMKEKLIRICARGRIAINLRGMEFLQRAPGEEEDAAWKRMRGRLGTGKHLDETYILLPEAVPQAHGSKKEQEGTVVGGTPPPGGNGGGEVTPVSPPSGGGEQTTGIFGGGGSAKVVSLTAAPTSPLNLLGKVESWGIGPATAVRQVTVKLNSGTGAQLQKLLRGLPDGLTYELSVEKEEP